MGNTGNTTEKFVNAGWNGDTKTVKKLLDRGVNINVKDEYGDAALHGAASNGHTETVKLLLDRGANINECGRKGNALHYAEKEGHTEIVKLLLDRGVNINVKALHDAARNGRTETVKLLLDRGVDINVKDNNGMHALHNAALYEHTETVKLLLDRGVDINVKNDYGKNALHYAAANGHTETVKLLLDQGVDINVLDNDKWHTLHYAANNGDTEIVKLLLDRGVDINVKDDYGKSALHYAANNGDTETVKLLLDQGIDINIKDNTRWHALQYAAFNGHTETVKLLLDRGVDINVKSNSQMKALEDALNCAKMHRETFKLILHRIRNGHTETTKNHAPKHKNESKSNSSNTNSNITPKSISKNSKDTSWSCSVCTYLNNMNNAKCKICEQETGPKISINLTNTKQTEQKLISSALVLLICVQEYFGDLPDNQIEASLNNNYNMNDLDQLIKNKNKNKLQDLKCTKMDKSNMLKLFGNKYGFDIIYNKYDHCTLADFYNILNIVEYYFLDEAKYQSLIFIFSGHGDKDNIILSDYSETKIHKQQIYYKYNKISRELITSYFNGGKFTKQIHKTKFYFLDCCRGNNDSFPINIDDESTNNHNNNNNNHNNIMQYAEALGSNNVQKSLHPDSNRCIFSSNTTGYQSYGYPNTGSILLTTLYELMYTQQDNANNNNLIELQDLIRENIENTKIIIKNGNEKIECKAILEIQTTMYNSDMQKIKFIANTSQDYEIIHSENARFTRTNKNIKMYCNCSECKITD